MVFFRVARGGRAPGTSEVTARARAAEPGYGGRAPYPQIRGSNYARAALAKGLASPR